MEQQTTRCHLKGHPEFALSYQEHAVVKQSLPYFISWLEESVLEGQRFLPGESVQFGWMYIRVSERPDGKLTLLEPDFKSLPISWTEDVSRTLSHLWYQKEVAASVGLLEKAIFPSYRQSAIVCRRLAGAVRVFLNRDKPSELNSGWFVGCDDRTHNHQEPAELERVSLYEAALRNPRMIPYMALPAGCYVRVGDRAPWIVFEDHVLPFLKNSYLAARQQHLGSDG